MQVLRLEELERDLYGIKVCSEAEAHIERSSG